MHDGQLKNRHGHGGEDQDQNQNHHQFEKREAPCAGAKGREFRICNLRFENQDLRPEIRDPSFAT
jgi:hypothetical protein